MNKGIIGLMAGACVLLGGVIVILQEKEDKKPPVISFKENNVIYKEGENYDKLLEGVTAVDDRDGDVSDMLVVENVYPDGEKAWVVYVARDASDNVSKQKRLVTYQSGLSVSQSVEQDTPEFSITDQQEDKKVVMQDTKNQNEDITNEVASEEKPTIKLTTDQITIHVGDTVNRITFVDSITDDKDDKDYLWGSIRITGDEFDSTAPGVYKQIYYVVDSDGNKSNEEILTITVE